MKIRLQYTLKYTIFIVLKNDITWEALRYPPEPPWRRKELCVDTSVSKEGNKKQNPEIIAAVANEKIDSSGNNLDLHIYTDGSKTLDGKTSAAFCIPEFDFKCGVRLTKVSDIVRLRQRYIRGKKPLLSVYVIAPDNL